MELKDIISHCKEYGFIYQSSEIYDGLAAVYDYGPLGVELKNNIKAHWWKSMVYHNEEITGLDAAILMAPEVWEASGHIEAFNDPLIDNKDSKKRYRADTLVEEYLIKIENKIDREVRKAKKRFGNEFDEDQFFNTSERVQRYRQEIVIITENLANILKNDDLPGLKKMIEDLDITDPASGSRNWTEVRRFNLMFHTQLGNIAGEESKLYLRPETAQGIFTNYLNVQKTTRQKIPFGIAQIGKAFRNEIIARQFIFRMREFEQMEMQYFVEPGTEMNHYENWREKRFRWLKEIGLSSENLRIHEHENLAHYANAALDIEYKFPFGFKELEGVHSRTDFDLSRHEMKSGKKLEYFDHEQENSYTPYVVETSIGLDRTVLAVLSEGLTEEEVPDAEGKASTRLVLKLKPQLAPVKCAVFPLLKKKEELTSLARNVFEDLKMHFHCIYDEKDAIGRRYRRQDAIGTPYCVTVDFDTIEDNSVTVRQRDTLEQDRVQISEVNKYIKDALSG